MSFECIVDNEFIFSQIRLLCIERRHREDIKFQPPCMGDAQYNCELSENGDIKDNNLKWWKYAECIGRCFIGKEYVSDWIDPLKKSRLIDCISSSSSIDWLLHLSRKRYRDHSNHQFFVGVLGWFLINCRLNGKESKNLTLKQYIAGKLNITEDDVEIAWWIASLLHDHAYPLAHMLKVVPSIIDENREILLRNIWNLLGFSSQPGNLDQIFKNLYSFPLLKELFDIALKAGNSSVFNLKKEIQNVLIDNLSSVFDEADEFNEIGKNCYDHGILAAANLASLLGESCNMQVIKSAIRAIGIHNGGVCSRKVHIGKDPLAILLILCDECQEWGRRILVGDQPKTESKQIRIRGIEKTEEGNYKINQCLTMIFEYPDAVCLNETEWNYPIFRASKESAFNRLFISKDFPIKQINFNIWIPHEKLLSSE